MSLQVVFARERGGTCLQGTPKSDRIRSASLADRGRRWRPESLFHSVARMPLYAASMRDLKIVHLNTVDSSGGAARAANRLHQGLIQSGVQSLLFVRERNSDDLSVIKYKISYKLIPRVIRLWRRKHLANQLRPYLTTRRGSLNEFSLSATEFGMDYLCQLPKCDLINVHWITGFIDYRAFAHSRIATIPCVFTLHDMNHFTGGCHFAGDCSRFTAQCGSCPQLGSSSPLDLSARTQSRKIAALKHRPDNSISVVANSEWLAAEARRSSILSRFPIFKIHYGLDTQVFAPRERAVARRILDLPQDTSIILAAADVLSNPRKGMLHLMRALEAMPSAGRMLLLFGKGSCNPPPNWSFVNLGKISDDRFLSVVYSAADVFVIPSLEDALPLTVLEAMACGIPVVGFDVGGLPDMIRDGESGYLVAKEDTSELRKAIDRILADTELRGRLSQNCRHRIETSFSLKTQAEAYIRLYRSMLANYERPPHC